MIYEEDKLSDKHNKFSKLSELLWLCLAYRNIFNHSTAHFFKRSAYDGKSYHSDLDGMEGGTYRRDWSQG